MEKKRIIFTMVNMGIGGVERALVGLLNSIDYSRYDVDLFLNNHKGEFLSLIPQSVNLLPEIEQYATFTGSSVELIKRGYWKIAIARKYPRLLSWLFGLTLGKEYLNNSFKHYQIKALLPLLPDINPQVEYDLAVAFIQPFHIVARKIRAKCKIGWLHADYSKLGINVPDELAYWGNMDKYVSISDMVSEMFSERFAALAPRLVRIDHLISKEFIVAQSHLEDVSERMVGSLRLCTVARLSQEKNILGAVEMCARLVERNPEIHWYVIGGADNDPGYANLVRAKIDELGMRNHFILLGSQANPYPFIAHCHIYIQPSFHEAKSIAVIEAQMLGKPTIITNYNTAQSQLRDGIDGVIVPMDTAQAARGILDVIENRELREMLHENCVETNYSNISEIEKFYALIP